MQQAGAPAPAYAPVTLVDRLTGLHAAYAVSAALYARERTGKGQAVEVPMFEAVAQFVLGDHMGGLTFEPPIGEPGYARLLTPQRRPYETRDGYLCVLIYNDKQWRSFFAAIGEPERFERDDALLLADCAGREHRRGVRLRRGGDADADDRRVGAAPRRARTSRTSRSTRRRTCSTTRISRATGFVRRGESSDRGHPARARRADVLVGDAARRRPRPRRGSASTRSRCCARPGARQPRSRRCSPAARRARAERERKR